MAWKEKTQTKKMKGSRREESARPDCCVITCEKVQLYKLSSQATVAEYEEAFQPAGFSAAPPLESLSVMLLDFLRLTTLYSFTYEEKKKPPKSRQSESTSDFQQTTFFVVARITHS